MTQIGVHAGRLITDLAGGIAFADGVIESSSGAVRKIDRPEDRPNLDHDRFLASYSGCSL